MVVACDCITNKFEGNENHSFCIHCAGPYFLLHHLQQELKVRPLPRSDSEAPLLLVLLLLLLRHPTTL
jgi:hypothetical protein